MVPEREVTSVPLYVTPREGGGRLASVSRRLTVLRTTQAPQVCFGLPADHQALSPGERTHACVAMVGGGVWCMLGDGEGSELGSPYQACMLNAVQQGHAC